MNSSRLVLFIAGLFIVIAVVLKLSQNKVMPVSPSTTSRATQAPTAPRTAAPPQAPYESTTQTDQNAAQEVPAQEAHQVVYVSDYEGKSPAFMALKAKIANLALQEYLADKGLRFYSPMKFYDFTLFESDPNTTGFDIATNELRQEMIIAVRRSTDAQDLLADLASQRGVSLSGNTMPRPIQGKPNFFSLTTAELHILFYAGPARSGHSAVIAWLQRTPFNSSQIEAFKNSITRTGL